MTKKGANMDETAINENLSATLASLGALKTTVTKTVATANTASAENQVNGSLKDFIDAVDKLKIALLHRIKH